MSTVTKYMHMLVPDPGDESFAPAISADLEGPVDGHDHITIGKPLSNAAITVSQDQPFNDFNLNTVRSVQFVNNSAPLAGTFDVNSAYFAEGNLWANDVNGNQIQITKNGAVNIGNFIFSSLDIFNVTNVSHAILYTDTYNALDISTTTTAVTITLPLANLVPTGRLYYFNDIANGFSTHHCTIAVSGGGDTIFGANLATPVTSVPLTANGQGGILYTDGVSKWYMVLFNQYTYNGQVITYNNASRINMDDTCGMNMPGYFLPNSTSSTVLAGAISIGSLGPDTGLISVDIANGIKSTASDGINSTVAGGIIASVGNSIIPTTAFGISSDITNGIQSQTGGGISTNSEGTIQSNNPDGGLVLNGGSNDWVTFNSTRSLSFTTPLLIGVDGYYAENSGWLTDGTSYLGPNYGGHTSNINVLPIKIPVPHVGATLTQVAINFFVQAIPSSTSSSFVFPSLAVTKTNTSNGTAPIQVSLSTTVTQRSINGTPTSSGNPTPTAYLNSGQYQALTFSCNQNNIIDGNSIYNIELVDQNGANVGSNGNIYTSLTFTYTISNMQLPV